MTNIISRNLLLRPACRRQSLFSSNVQTSTIARVLIAIAINAISKRRHIWKVFCRRFKYCAHLICLASKGSQMRIMSVLLFEMLKFCITIATGSIAHLHGELRLTCVTKLLVLELTINLSGTSIFVDSMPTVGGNLILQRIQDIIPDDLICHS